MKNAGKQNRIIRKDVMKMNDVKKEYIVLFNGITDAIDSLQKQIDRLKFLQVKAEEIYIENGEEEEKETDSLPRVSVG